MDTEVGVHFGVATAPSMSVRPVGNAHFSVTHLCRQVRAGNLQAIHLPAQPAYFMMLYLRDTDHCDIAAGGVETVVRCYRKASVCLVDLREGASIRLHSDLDALAFHLPYCLFNEVGSIPQAPQAMPLRCLRGSGDRIMWNIGCALLPLFERQDVEAVLRPIAIAACVHLLQHYTIKAAAGEAPLSAWQEKDAKEFMADHLQDDIAVADIAEQVGMSAADFVEAFGSTVGITPQRWLALLRVERAKECLYDRRLTIAEVAEQCGFAGESQLNEVFFDQTGITPDVWRRGLFH
ncbi:AraC family transcriptional regulator [Mesorhizobium sp. B2-4-17]|uniref:AraC family transcriptional regulator n=1 Tax=Mesorhizobium sp. B2-4-17 TaxID=2589932 RepID=UPI0011272A74|nr:AraC family transcriptional regulator [Mesorhizobium sp. B2-4-17]TPK78126.1 helix-turn-helix transcriptional regulator [Mesorhizobium sp. B2-4-17]